MTDLRYSVTIEPLSEADGGGFVAFVPDLPGCMSDGETPEEALANVKGAIETWIDAADAPAHANGMADLVSGKEELLTAKEALALAEAATPLAFWRSKRVMTQGELAARAGVSQSAIADMERGERAGAAAVLKRVAEALGVRIEDLISE
ncbi:type II toxin-antitoxin system HicB family antitoxin [Methylocapsa polymorpha]|uniref:Type II toxin-antitoxin system HicB family antitoxin n=1 Tax=Methylocapsa polymorpha TaxID=3080828 RepID=A0ABZ0HT15_9HYPH|nr:type II toxin-antitoxin system HicB family antitoxin [Methylocapsa sp. RX1]